MADELVQIKERARQTWAAGDFPVVGELIGAVGRHVVRRTGVGPQDRVLDVGCGAGNAAIPAAQAGATVVGSDITPELLEAGRKAAAEAGVELEWVEADAEDLPFEDASFDVVVSTFGHMFAPRHDVSAREVVRVLAPGGRMGLCTWTPEGAIGEFFVTIGGHLPPPPAIAQSPILWGKEDHVRELFAGTGVELTFEREIVDIHFATVEHGVELYERYFGPIVKARELLEPQGKWPALHADLVSLFERHSVPAEMGLAYPAEYLVILGRAPAA
jgi:SAM-dependent methyltransferase